MFGKCKPRLGGESMFEECKPRLGNATVASARVRIAAGVVSCHLYCNKESSWESH
jgi:hypothetical protein